jgi:hypothetical protein
MPPQQDSTVKLDTGGPRITLPSAERAKAKGTNRPPRDISWPLRMSAHDGNIQCSLDGGMSRSEVSHIERLQFS